MKLCKPVSVWFLKHEYVRPFRVTICVDIESIHLNSLPPLLKHFYSWLASDIALLPFRSLNHVELMHGQTLDGDGKQSNNLFPAKLNDWTL